MMMSGAIQLRSLPCRLVRLGHVDPRNTASVRSTTTTVFCNAHSGNESDIPKLEAFSRSRIDRRKIEPSFLQKTENELADYCCILEGDESYSCWRAYFELKDLEKELPKEDVEKFLRQAGGKKSQIDCLHGITAMDQKDKKNKAASEAAAAENPAHPVAAEKKWEKPFPSPDGLPKTREELDEEENDLMPDSPFTRLLRSKGSHPAWYSQVPDHETD